MLPSSLHLFAVTCSGGSFLGFPTWYKYLSCDSNNTPQLNSINNIWLIGAAVIEILIRIAALLAIGFIIRGGIQYTLSQGDPEKAAKGRQTIIYSVVGLVLAIASTAVITFAAGSFH